MTEEDRPYIARMARGLLDCAAAAVDPSACRVLLTPGQTATWDNCCEGDCEGQLWVAVQNIWPSREFPTPQPNRFKCGVSMLVVRMQLGIVRCSQAMTDGGKAPPAERVEYEAVRNLRDHESMVDAVLCCWAPVWQDTTPWAMEGWEPLGPRGGCVGGAMQVLAAVGGCPGGCDHAAS